MSLQTFFDNFALLADTPNSIPKLREFILQLAVCGKLDTQKTSDVPASDLLQKILAGNGKQYSPPEVVQCSLPSNWTWIRFGDIFDVQGGTQPPKNEFLTSPAEGYVRLLQIRDLGTRPEPIYVKRNSVRNLCTTEDIMLARYGASVGKIFMGQDGAYNVALTKVIFDHKYIFNRFVFFLLKSSLFQDKLKPMSRSAQAGFNKGDVYPILLPLPPLEEQKRIVAKIDELMLLCDELEAKQYAKRESRVRLNNSALASLNKPASVTSIEFGKASSRLAENFEFLYDSIETLDKLRSTILQLAMQGKLVRQDSSDEPAHVFFEKIKKQKKSLFGKGLIKKNNAPLSIAPDETAYPIPPSWRWVRIEDISDIGTGSTPLSSNLDYYNGGTIAWVTSAATSEEYIHNVPIRITQKAVDDYRLRVYPPETLVVALYGQGKTRGQISQLKIAATVNQACAAICLVETSEEHSWFVRRFFEQSYEDLRALAAGGAQPNLNVRKIKETLIPLPPLAEQKRIVTKVNQLMALCDDLEAKIRQAQTHGEKLMNAAVQHVLQTVSSAT